LASLPAEVLDRTGHYLKAADVALPGLVIALYVVGSAALGVWQQGHSDIDTVIVTSRPLTADDLAALEKIHAALPEMPKFDGIYLDQALFDQRPVDRRVIPFVVNGEFKIDKPCGELTPRPHLAAGPSNRVYALVADILRTRSPRDQAMHDRESMWLRTHCRRSTTMQV
jgi:hypothetical protein